MATPVQATKSMPRRRPRRVKIDVRKAVQEWLKASDAASAFLEQANNGKKLLMGILEEDGTSDEHGSQWINFPDDPVAGRIKAIKRERYVTRTLKPADEVEKYLRDKGLYDECTETVTVIDEYKIRALNFGPNAKIPDDEFRDLYIVTENFRFCPQRIKQ